MEVHHHPDLHHKSKAWKEYFLEGFMIFVAVMLGFFAESLRESIGDKEKEKEYISSFIKNLQEDTLFLNTTVRYNTHKMNGLDSLLALATKNIDDAQIRKSLYTYSSRYVSNYSIFISNDATMMQLKNAGGLRFIRKDHVADSIAKYDFNISDIYAAEKLYAKAQDDALTMQQEILVETIYRDTTYFNNHEFTSKKLPLVTTDPEKLKIFFNKIAYEEGWTENYINNINARIPYAISLIAFLKKEYDIE
jgi:hypothetical protein